MHVPMIRSGGIAVNAPQTKGRPVRWRAEQQRIARTKSRIGGNAHRPKKSFHDLVNRVEVVGGFIKRRRCVHIAVYGGSVVGKRSI